MSKEKTIINDFIKKVKENKKYKSISEDIVRKEIDKYKKRYQSDVDDIYDEKFALKKIRKELHRLYSSYQTKGKKKRVAYLEELKKDSTNLEIVDKLLSTTVSTKERSEYYVDVYKKIFEITGKPKTILDLGSGLNPLSLQYMNLQSLSYYAYDIDLDDIKFLNDYFKIMKNKGVNGKAEILDIRDLEKISNLPSSDVIFMFKVYDLIVPKNKKERKLGEELIKLLIRKTKFIVVSFATKTLTRRSMKLPIRRGFELMLERNNLKFENFSIENEVFYVVYRKEKVYK